MLRLWLHHDKPFNAPGNGNPLLPGYYADPTILSTGHHTLLRQGADTYLIYHRFNTVNEYNIVAKLRQVCADKLLYNPDGSIQRVVTTHGGLGAPGTRPNLASRAPVTSSADLDPKTRASYATDENNGTLWIGKPGPTAWLTVDLDAVRPVKEVAIYPEFPIYSYQFEVLTSNDNRTWTTAGHHTSPPTLASPLTVALPAAQARYVRVQLTQRSGGPRAGLWEVKVY